MTDPLTLQGLALGTQAIALIYMINLYDKGKKGNKEFLELLHKHNDLADRLKKAAFSDDPTLHKELHKELEQLIEEGIEKCK